MGNCFFGRPLTHEHDDLFTKTSVNLTEYTNSIVDLATEQDASHLIFGTSVKHQNAGDLGEGDNMNQSACNGLYANHQPTSANSLNQLNSQIDKRNNMTQYQDSPDSKIWSQKENCSPVVNQFDEDIVSCFGEHWDPVLFDQRRRSPVKCGVLCNFSANRSQQSTIRRHEGSIVKRTRFPTSQWSSINNLTRHSPRRRGLSLISSGLLGFSQFQSSGMPILEWYRNGEFESPLFLKDDFRIQGKQKAKKSCTEINDNNRDDNRYIQSTQSKKECQISREGWLRYTMFLHQQKADAVEFYATFRKAKHVFLSLEAKTGCEVRFSKQLFVHKGKYVRAVVIDGPSRKNILRCYSSLPRLFADLIILECERPSISEPKIHVPHCRMEAELTTSSMLPAVV